MEGTTAAALLKEARRRSGLSQAEFAHRAGVTQSVISVYEQDRRQPSFATLQRMVAAVGLVLEARLQTPDAPHHPLPGPLGQRLDEHRDAVLQVVSDHGASNPRVFGSVARGEETADSDIDLLVDVSPRVGLFELGWLRQELESMLQTRVDLVPAGGLKPGVSVSVQRDAIPL